MFLLWTRRPSNFIGDLLYLQSLASNRNFMDGTAGQPLSVSPWMYVCKLLQSTVEANLPTDCSKSVFYDSLCSVVRFFTFQNAALCSVEGRTLAFLHSCVDGLNKYLINCVMQHSGSQKCLANALLLQ